MSPRLPPATFLLVVLAAGCTSTAQPLPNDVAEIPDSVIQYALETTPSGEVVNWRTADSGVHGTITPVRTYRTAGGYCRDYAVTLSAPTGRGSTWQARACRDGDGIWRLMSAGA